MENLKLPRVEYRQMVCPNCHTRIILPVLQYDVPAHTVLDELAELAKKRQIIDEEMRVLETIAKEAKQY